MEVASGWTVGDTGDEMTERRHFLGVNELGLVAPEFESPFFDFAFDIDVCLFEFIFEHTPFGHITAYSLDDLVIPV